MFYRGDKVDFTEVVGYVIETSDLFKFPLEFFMFHWYSVLKAMEQVHHWVVCLLSSRIIISLICVPAILAFRLQVVVHLHKCLDIELRSLGVKSNDFFGYFLNREEPLGLVFFLFVKVIFD